MVADTAAAPRAGYREVLASGSYGKSPTAVVEFMSPGEPPAIHLHYLTLRVSAAARRGVVRYRWDVIERSVCPQQAMGFAVADRAAVSCWRHAFLERSYYGAVCFLLSLAASIACC